MSKKAGIRRLMLEQIIRHGRITRNEAMEVAQTRLATIGEVVQTLLAEGIIEEPERVGRESTGRRASPLCFRGEYGYFLGIVLSPDCVKAVLLDNAGNLKAPMITGEVHENNPEAVFQSILDVLSKLRQQVGDAVWGTIRATGFADPGLVNEKTGTSIRAVNLPGWENIETAQRLKKILGGPVIMRPEMAARAYAERLLEGMVDDFGCFHLNLYDGVGGAYTRGLDVFVGDSFCQMEIGHVIVEEDGALCHCGNHGCLEALVGEVGLTHRVEQ
ncbi:MAG: ROK family protein, partial [Verrucomicrobia bacterium]|nr:ROK family protein [Verrucomicrobiota bacterium]